MDTPPDSKPAPKAEWPWAIIYVIALAYGLYSGVTNGEWVILTVFSASLIGVYAGQAARKHGILRPEGKTPVRVYAIAVAFLIAFLIALNL